MSEPILIGMVGRVRASAGSDALKVAQTAARDQPGADVVVWAGNRVRALLRDGRFTDLAEESDEAIPG
jgi:hypothetical protein